MVQCPIHANARIQFWTNLCRHFGQTYVGIIGQSLCRVTEPRPPALVAAEGSAKPPWFDTPRLTKQELSFRSKRVRKKQHAYRRNGDESEIHNQSTGNR